LKVTASNAFAERWLMPRLQKFCDSYPGVSLDLKLSDSTIDIASEGIDVALRLLAQPQGALVTTKLMDTHYRVVASPDYIAASKKNHKTHPPVRSSLLAVTSSWLPIIVAIQEKSVDNRSSRPWSHRCIQPAGTSSCGTRRTWAHAVS